MQPRSVCCKVLCWVAVWEGTETWELPKWCKWPRRRNSDARFGSKAAMSSEDGYWLSPLSLTKAALCAPCSSLGRKTKLGQHQSDPQWKRSFWVGFSCTSDWSSHVSCINLDSRLCQEFCKTAILKKWVFSPFFTFLPHSVLEMARLTEKYFSFLKCNTWLWQSYWRWTSLSVLVVKKHWTRSVTVFF